jgi:hypothetical protein
LKQSGDEGVDFGLENGAIPRACVSVVVCWLGVYA